MNKAASRSRLMMNRIPRHFSRREKTGGIRPEIRQDFQRLIKYFGEAEIRHILINRAAVGRKEIRQDFLTNPLEIQRISSGFRPELCGRSITAATQRRQVPRMSPPVTSSAFERSERSRIIITAGDYYHNINHGNPEISVVNIISGFCIIVRFLR